jgi:transposase
MKQLVIAGIDVSKTTLDICIKPFDLFLKISNDLRGFNQWLKQLKELAVCPADVLVVMEHTGKYSSRLESFLRSESIGYCKVAALQIKRSLGMIRGKNDKIDARRIAEYGWLRRDILKADKPLDDDIRRLRELLNLRQKLVRDRAGYISRLKELQCSGDCTKTDVLGKMQQELIAMFTAKIAVLERQISSLIETHEAVKRTYDLLRSIKGVGPIVAAYMIGCTDNFERFVNARKFNCYAGLAPFKYESGSSIKGKGRVSHLANKAAKTLLNLAACSAIRHNEEMKEYYQRRVAEGKRKMSCLNIIRSKLVARMFAVIKRQTAYEPILNAA